MDDVTSVVAARRCIFQPGDPGRIAQWDKIASHYPVLFSGNG
jgi:hypothetical protein